MNNPKNTGHWDTLAQDLGADVAPSTSDDVTDTSADASTGEMADGSAENAEVDANRPQIIDAVGVGKGSGKTPGSQADVSNRDRRPRKKEPIPTSHHWESLAGSLGIAVPEPSESPSPAAEASPGPPELGLTGDSLTSPNPPRTDVPDDATPAPTVLTDISGLDSGDIAPATETFIDELPEIDVFEAESEEPLAESTDDASEVPDDTLESDDLASTDVAADTPGRKPRRRRGRRGRRRRGIRNAASDESDSAEVCGQADAFGDSVASDHDDSSQRSATGDDEGELETSHEPAVTDGSDADRRTDDAFPPRVASGTRDQEADRTRGPDKRRESRSGEERGRPKRPNRKFPTWSEAVGIIITQNVESRQKSGSSGGSRGRKRRPGGRRR